MREYVLITLIITFGGEGSGVVELEHFDKHFVKSTRIRGSAGKHLENLSPRYS